VTTISDRFDIRGRSLRKQAPGRKHFAIRCNVVAILLRAAEATDTLNLQMFRVRLARFAANVRLLFGSADTRHLFYNTKDRKLRAAALPSPITPKFMAHGGIQSCSLVG
jgi:hypothetical protein